MVDIIFWKANDFHITLYSKVFEVAEYSFGSKKNYEKKKIPDFLVLFSKFGAILDFILDQTHF